MENIGAKMEGIATAIENKISASNRTKEQEACVENVTSFCTGPIIEDWTSRYSYISRMFNAFELETLKKHNING